MIVFTNNNWIVQWCDYIFEIQVNPFFQKLNWKLELYWVSHKSGKNEIENHTMGIIQIHWYCNYTNQIVRFSWKWVSDFQRLFAKSPNLHSVSGISINKIQFCFCQSQSQRKSSIQFWQFEYPCFVILSNGTHPIMFCQSPSSRKTAIQFFQLDYLSFVIPSNGTNPIMFRQSQSWRKTSIQFCQFEYLSFAILSNGTHPIMYRQSQSWRKTSIQFCQFEYPSFVILSNGTQPIMFSLFQSSRKSSI